MLYFNYEDWLLMCICAGTVFFYDSYYIFFVSAPFDIILYYMAFLYLMLSKSGLKVM